MEMTGDQSVEVTGTPAQPTRWRRGARLCAGILTATLIYAAMAPFVGVLVLSFISAVRDAQISAFWSNWINVLTYGYFYEVALEFGGLAGLLFTVPSAFLLKYSKGKFLGRFILAVVVGVLMAWINLPGLPSHWWIRLMDDTAPAVVLLLAIPPSWLRRLLRPSHIEERKGIIASS